jgi:hypothetical protein
MPGSAILRGALVCLAVALTAATVHAQLFRAYLASGGNDGNPCTLAAPCRLLPAALNAVADGGEIWMLDSANYNIADVAVTKSVSIQAAPGALGSVVAVGNAAIVISTPGLTVALRNLAILPYLFRGPSPIEDFRVGVQMDGPGSTLTMENCLLGQFAVESISVRRGTLTVANTTFRRMYAAIDLAQGASAMISKVQILGACIGVRAHHGLLSAPAATVTASISDSLISGNPKWCYRTSGVVADANHGTVARISMTRTTVENTHYALRSVTRELVGLGRAEISVGDSLIVDNEYAWYQDGSAASILSLGNNQMSGNIASVGTLTPLAPQ